MLPVRRNIIFAHAEAPQVFERQIDPALGVVHANVLPEVRQLQRGAGEIGKLLPLRIAIAAKIQHEMADRIRRIAAIAEQVVESWVARHRLILTKRRQQVGKALLGNFEVAEPSRPARQTPDAAGLPCVASVAAQFRHWSSNCKRGAGIADLIAQIVRDAAVRINVEEMLTQALAAETRLRPKSSRSARCQTSAVSLRFRKRWSNLREWRTPAAGCSSPPARQISTSAGIRCWRWMPWSVRLPAGQKRSSCHQCPGMMAVLISPLRFSMWRNTCCNRERGASPVM